MSTDKIRSIISASANRNVSYAKIARDLSEAHPSIAADLPALERVYLDAAKDAMFAECESPEWDTAYDVAKIAEELLEIAWRAAAEVAS
jgi:hypothetical protein